MRVFAIVANDRKDSLTQYFFMQAVECMKAQHSVELDVLDLYDRAKEIPFYWSDPAKLESYPFFQENKKRFMAADRLLLSFPTYWYATPGILKCWIDLITNYAWRLEQGYYAKPLHKIHKTLCINSSLTPSWFNKYILRNPAHNQLRYTFKFWGIYHNSFYEIGDTKNLNDAKTAAHVAAIKQQCKQLVTTAR